MDPGPGVDPPGERGDGFARRLDSEVEVDPLEAQEEVAEGAADEVEVEPVGGLADCRQRRYRVESPAEALGRDLGLRGARQEQPLQPCRTTGSLP